MDLPGFLCIGAQKAGTTWLFSQLQSHPKVWMPPIKELQYFSHLFVPEHRRWTTWHIENSIRNIVKHQVGLPKGFEIAFVNYITSLSGPDMFTEAWYRRAFDRPIARNRLIGDITPEYSTIPDAGVAYVRRLLGPVKIIYIIRCPLTRALSQLRMNASRRGMARISRDEWIALADEWDIANRGDYKTYIPRWKAHFADGDLHFVPYGRISKAPQKVLADIEAFLGLPEHEYVRAGERIHAGARMEVPDEAVDHLTRKLADQRDFLTSEFGEAFVEQI